MLAFENSKRISEEVKKPKALGDIRGVLYRDSFLVSVLFCSLDKFLLKIVQVNNGITLIYHQFTEMPTVHR